MIDWKKFNKKDLFKSRMAQVASGLLILILVIFLLIAFVKHRAAKTAAEAPEAERESVNIKTTSEAISNDILWRQSIQEKMNAEKLKMLDQLKNLSDHVDEFKEVQKTKDLDKLSAFESKLDNLNAKIQSAV